MEWEHICFFELPPVVLLISIPQPGIHPVFQQSGQGACMVETVLGSWFSPETAAAREAEKLSVSLRPHVRCDLMVIANVAVLDPQSDYYCFSIAMRTLCMVYFCYIPWINHDLGVQHFLLSN